MNHYTTKLFQREHQIDAVQHFCRSLGFKSVPVYKDIGSGLNTKRMGFLKFCRKIESGKINHIVLTYPDRLTRFGFRYLEHYFASYGASIEIINQSADASPEQELVQDLISIITSFYG